MNEQKMDDKIKQYLTNLPRQEVPDGFADSVMMKITADKGESKNGKETSDWVGNLVIAMAIIMIFFDSVTLVWLGNAPVQYKSRKIMISEFSKMYFNAEPQMFQAEEENEQESK